MREFTEEETAQHKESLKEMFELAEEEKIKQQRDKLLELLKEAAICIPLVDLRNRIDEAIMKIEGDGE